MGKNILFGVVGLVVGLAVGFFYANNLNRTELTPQQSVQTSATDPNSGQQVPNIEVKDQPQTGGMLPDIAKTLDKAKNEPDNFDAQIQAGELYFKIKNFDKASEFYDKASSLNPTKYEQIVKLGNAFFDVKQFEKAGKLYSQALEQKPDDVSVRTDLGITFVERANPDVDRAIQEFDKSLQDDPKHEPTLYNLGIAYYKKGNLQESQNILAKLKEVNPQSELATKLEEVLQNK